VDPLGAGGDAVELRVAAPNPLLGIQYLQPFVDGLVARVEEAEHGAVDRRRAEIAAAGAQNATRAVTGAAGDAVELALRLPAKLGSCSRWIVKRASSTVIRLSAATL